MRICAGSEKFAGHRRIGVLQNVFSLSVEYTQDLRFVQGWEKCKILEKDFYAWIILNVISFLHSLENYFDVVDRKVKTESVDAKLS